MAANVISVDIPKAEAAAKNIKAISNDMDSAMKKLNKIMTDSGSWWKGDTYKKFCDAVTTFSTSFKETTKQSLDEAADSLNKTVKKFQEFDSQ